MRLTAPRTLGLLIQKDTERIPQRLRDGESIESVARSLERAAGILRTEERLRFPSFVQEAYRFMSKNNYPTCVYVLWGNEKSLYVGQTDDLIRRLKEHSMTAVWFPEIDQGVYIACPKGNALTKEQELIRDLDPVYNVIRRKW